MMSPYEHDEVKVELFYNILWIICGCFAGKNVHYGHVKDHFK